MNPQWGYHAIIRDISTNYMEKGYIGKTNMAPPTFKVTRKPFIDLSEILWVIRCTF